MNIFTTRTMHTLMAIADNRELLARLNSDETLRTSVASELKDSISMPEGLSGSDYRLLIGEDDAVIGIEVLMQSHDDFTVTTRLNYGNSLRSAEEDIQGGNSRCCKI